MKTVYHTARPRRKPAANRRHELQLLANLESVIQHACEFHDGHFYIFSFTTGYKGSFGTPNLDGPDGCRDEIWNLEGFKSVEELLEHMLTPSCGCIRLSGRGAR